MPMEKFFKLKERNTNVRTELIAGLTTFVAMAYILAVNPAILSAASMDRGAVFSATAISAGIATLVMALFANLPYALAPGMGLNAFFALTVCTIMGYSWQFAITAVFVEGILFIILTLLNVREAIISSIPKNIKSAISVGIGFFIAFIGLQNAEIIVSGTTLVELGDITSGPALLAVCGLLITSVLLAYKVKGALLIGIVLTTLLGIPFGLTKVHEGSWLPPSLEPTFWKFAFDEVAAHPVDFIIVCFSFLFVDMFDTVGTLIACATKAGMVEEDGTVQGAKEALLADAVGTTVGAILGTSTVTTVVESSTGIVSGGRTGLTAAAKQAGVSFCARSQGGMMGLFFLENLPNGFNDVMKADPAVFAKFFHTMLEEGVYLAPSIFEAGFVSAAHSDEDIEATIAAARKAFAAL